MLGTSFNIGRSALNAYQAALSIAGQNIANVANPDYTRQSGRLEAQIGGTAFGIRPGSGVRLAQLQRHIDEALENRLRLAFGERAGAEATYNALSRTEARFNELTEQDISTQLSEFFSTFGGIQAQPNDTTPRNITISSARTMVDNLHRQRSGLVQQSEDLNEEVRAAVGQINNLADEISRLNQQIVTQESTGTQIAGALRDRRDGLLRDMSELIDVQVREQDNGSINVYVGSEPLVEFNRARELKAETVLDNGLEYAEVRFADNDGLVIVRGGKLGGLLQSRDNFLAEQLNRLDLLAKALIYETNKLHATGRGITGVDHYVSEYGVSNPDAALNTPTGSPPFDVENGTFEIKVRDADTGQTITRLIEVDLDGLNGDDTTLRDLANQLNNVPGVSAQVTADNRLEIDSPGNEVWFSEDSSGALAALGVNSFFTGQHAGDIDIHPEIESDPLRISAGLTAEVNDGANAGRMAALASTTSELLGGMTIADYHATSMGRLATDTSAALTEAEAADAVYSSLQAQRESVSGVSLDEEAINLTRYEQAFQGASRYLGVLNNISNEVLALVR